MTITITTPQQRDQLPGGVIVRSADGTLACRHPSGVGVLFGDDRPFDWDRLTLPITVLITPGLTLALDQAAIAATIRAAATDHGMTGIDDREADLLAGAVHQALTNQAPATRNPPTGRFGKGSGNPT